MSIKLELNGIVFKKGEPTTRNDFTTQNMILHIPDLKTENFSDYFNIEWNEKGIETIKKAEILDGDEVKVVAYLTGRKWIDKEGADRSFNAIKGYAIEKAENNAAEELTPFPILDTPEKETDDDLPF